MSDMSAIWRRVQLMLRPASVTQVDESGPTQKLQIRHNDLETHDGIRAIQQYGLASSPPINSEVVTAAINADASSKIVIATHHAESRPRNLGTADVCLYNQAGTRITLKGGNVEIVTGGKVSIKGNVEVEGNITATGDITAGNISLKSHVHTAVQSGNGRSGPPSA